MNQREVKGKEIVEKNNQIKRIDESHYKVNSQSRDKHHDVIALESGWFCSCEDHSFRKTCCKHIHAVEISLSIRKEVENKEGANQFLEFERHTWSRVSNDNHSSYLNCGTGTNSDKCAVKIKIFSDVKKTGVSKADVTSEVAKIEARFDGMNKNMSFDKVSRADNYISSKDLKARNTGFTEYTLHCTDKFLWHCVTYDKHFVKMELFINTANRVNWNTSEICRNDQVIQYDIEKTLGHELLHVVGVDHNSRPSDVRGTPYTCGSTNGYDLSTADKTKVGALYP